MARVIDENSKPGIYMGAGFRDGKWWPIMTVVHPPYFRPAMGAPIEHMEYQQTFDTEMEAEAFIRTEVLPDVIQNMGAFFDHTEELRPVGNA